MNDIFFSVITCTKNSDRFILRNIESVDNQTFKNIEQIVIDGDSKDTTTEIINKFVKKNSKKYKLFSFPAKGISNAFNQGIKKSSGKYLFFLNSDDYFFDKSVLVDIYNFLTNNSNLDWIYGKINVVEESGKKVGVFPERKLFQSSDKRLLKYVNFIPHQAVFIKREVFKKFGNFDESLETSMDRDLWLRILDKTKWSFFDRIVAGYTIRAGSASSSAKRRSENEKRAEAVQKRYLNAGEIVLARIVTKIIYFINKTNR